MMQDLITKIIEDIAHKYGVAAGRVQCIFYENGQSIDKTIEVLSKINEWVIVKKDCVTLSYGKIARIRLGKANSTIEITVPETDSTYFLPQSQFIADEILQTLNKVRSE